MSSNFEQSEYLEKGLNSTKNGIGKTKEKLKRKRNCSVFIIHLQLKRGSLNLNRGMKFDVYNSEKALALLNASHNSIMIRYSHNSFCV